MSPLRLALLLLPSFGTIATPVGTTTTNTRNVAAVTVKADGEEVTAATIFDHNVLVKTDGQLSDHRTPPPIAGPPRFFTFFGEPSWATSPPSFDVFNMQAALGVDQLNNLTQFRVPSNPNLAGSSFLPQNTSGVLFDLGDSGPIWGPDQPPGTPFWMQPGAAAWAHNLTASTLRPLVKDGALRVIFLGDERLCSGVPAADVRALAAAVHDALNGSVVDEYGVYWPGLRRGIDYFVYVNECCQLAPDGSVIKCPFGGANKPIIDELDLISIDSYAAGSSEAAAVQTILTRHIYPNLQPHQSVMLVPGLFGDLSKPVEPAAEDLLVAKLDAYWQWAQADERVLGFCAWHWADRGEVGKPDPTAIKRGASSFPKVVRAIQRLVTRMVPRACGRGYSGPLCAAAPCCSDCGNYCATHVCNSTQKLMMPACNCGASQPISVCQGMCNMSSFCHECDRAC